MAKQFNNLKYAFGLAVDRNEELLDTWDVIVQIDTPIEGTSDCLLSTNGIADSKEKERAVFELSEKYLDNEVREIFQTTPEFLRKEFVEQYGKFENNVVIFFIKNTGEQKND